LGRGFFAGILWGAVVGAVMLALASQLTARREAPVVGAPQQAELEIPGESEFNRPPPDAEPVLPAGDAAPAAEAPAAVAAPEPVTPPIVADTEPAAAPEAVAETPAPAAAVEVPETAEIAAPAVEAPAAPEAAPEVVAAPEPDAVVAAVPERSPVEAPAEVAQPAAPAAEEVAAAPAVTEAAPAAVAPAPAPAAPASPPVVLPGAVTPPAAPEAGENRIALSRAGDAAPAEARVASPVAPGADAAPGAVAEPPVAPAAEAVAVEPPAAPEAPATAESAAEPEVAAPEVAQLPEPAEAPTGGMTAGTAPTPGFGNADGVRVNRLPRIGDPEPAAEAAAEAAPEAEAPADAVLDEDVPALVRNAVVFDNPEGRPVVAVVLLHDLAVMPGAETGLDLPVPVSFAVDAGLVEAGAVADAYRAAGREVLLVPTLPPGAAASDVEVALQVNLDVIPEAVAIMDLPEGGFQSEREAVAQVVNAITATGHGLVTFPRGLNMAQQMADRAGVAARPVFRMLEAGDADAALRTLDQAAFRARQEGAVILVGEAEPATVEAIRRWAEANPDGEILLGPVSAALGAPQ
jgi:polysaccharide deacetylase 2 family uncharacterized protein YibQ